MATPEDSELEYAGQPVRELLADLDAPDVKTRARAARTLFEVTFDLTLENKPVPEWVIVPLVDALRDPEGRVRGRAAEALGVAGDSARRALPHLMELLDDDEEEDYARCRIAVAVAELGAAREAAPILLRLLRQGSSNVREAAGQALDQADLSGLNVEGQLRACLDDDSPVVRTWVCGSLWNLTHQGAELVPILLAAMRKRRARTNAARMLCRMKEQAIEALPHLLRLWNDPDWSMRFQAVKATQYIPCSDELALPILEALRDDPERLVRRTVARALEERGCT